MKRRNALLWGMLYLVAACSQSRPPQAPAAANPASSSTPSVTTDSLVGDWFRSCTFLDDSHNYEVWLTFKPDGTLSIAEVVFTDNQCSSSTYIITQSGHYELGSANQLSVSLDPTYVAPQNDQTTQSFNQRAFGGFTNWQTHISQAAQLSAPWTPQSGQCVVIQSSFALNGLTLLRVTSSH